jgi:ABC-2 type transport system permease protein
MTTAHLPAGPRTAPVPRQSSLGPVRETGFRDALKFEWIKIKTVRSTLWSLLAAAVLVIGIGVLAAANVHDGSDKSAVMEHIYGGLMFGQMAILVFGVLAATAEYGTGTIGTSFTAVPSRTRLLAAKALVVWLVSTVIGLAISIVTFVAGLAAVPSGAAVMPSIAEDSVLRAVVGAGLYLGVLGVFALAIGLILRASAGAVTAVISAALVIPIGFLLLGRTGEFLSEWWPTEAGRQILAMTHSPHTLSPVTGLAYFGVAALALLVGAVTLVNRRDA